MTKKDELKKSYRELSEELNRLLEWFDGGDVDVDEAIENYQKALDIIDQMEERLKTAENKIKKIAKKFEQ